MFGDWWKMSDYPQPFHCVRCELGWTDKPSCWNCGKKGLPGQLPSSKLMHDSVAATSAKPSTHFSNTIPRTN